MPAQLLTVLFGYFAPIFTMSCKALLFVL